MNRYKLLSMFALLPAVVVATACDDDDGTGMMDPELPEALDIVETAEAAGSFNTLLTAVNAAGLTSALQGAGPLTVFAPTDAAFAALPAGTLDALLGDPDALAQILLYHVAPGDLASGSVAAASFIPTLNGQALPVTGSGSALEIAGAGLVDTDIEATNGVIHVVDEVLLPSDQNLVEIAQGNPSFSTLVAAVVAADLVDALTADGPYTVFAPTDDAFANLPEGTLDALLDDPETLAQILTYHVVAGRVYSSDVSPGPVETLNGQSFTVTVEGGAVQVDGATVVATDIQGTNGIIHVIDQVILPEGL